MNARCFFITICLLTHTAGAAEDWPGLKKHGQPKALPAGAVTEDWPRFLGPRDQPISGETKLTRKLDTMPRVWECEIGAGYACPVIVGDRLVFFHRVNKNEQVLCLDPVTGQRYWQHDYEIEYRDRFGYSDGPRASAVIAGDAVITFGVSSWLKCLELKTGTVRWEHDCAKKYQVPQYFFGTGATPVVHEGKVLVNLGTSDGICVAAFDLKTGEMKWKTPHEWGQSYASPLVTKMQGKERLLVFAGGESTPSTGGLLSIDPADGKIDDAFFWRARRYPSVNASTPTLCGENQVFLTQSYIDRDSPCNGGVMLEMTPERKWRARWKNEALACHWMTPVFHEGHLYSVCGEKESTAEIACHDAATGAEKWRENPTWDFKLPNAQTLPMGFKRASLLRVDGAFLCLGEWGSLAWLDLSPQGLKIIAKTQLFVTQETWTLPAISRGLLYITQHGKDELNGSGPRMICYDMRAEPTNAP